MGCDSSIFRAIVIYSSKVSWCEKFSARCPEDSLVTRQKVFPRRFGRTKTPKLSLSTWFASSLISLVKRSDNKHRRRLCGDNFTQPCDSAFTALSSPHARRETSKLYWDFNWRSDWIYFVFQNKIRQNDRGASQGRQEIKDERALVFKKKGKASLGFGQ